MVVVFIETPKGSTKKYELVKGKLKINKHLRKGFAFPGNYGFFPKTLGGDRDALDVLVLGRKAKKGAKINVKPIGIMHMIDGKDQDDKVIASSRARKLKKTEMEQIEYFFKHYKRRKVNIRGFGGVEKAKKAILEAKKRYR